MKIKVKIDLNDEICLKCKKKIGVCLGFVSSIDCPLLSFI